MSPAEYLKRAPRPPSRRTSS